MNLNPNEIPEDGGPLETQAKKDIYAFATLVIGWGELAVVASIQLINVQVFRQNSKIIRLYNELFAYNDKLLSFLEERNIQLDLKHKKEQQKGEVYILIQGIGSIVLCFLLLLTCLHPLEPTHVIIKDWLELEFEWRPALVPWIIMFTCAVQSCGNAILTIGLLVEFHVFMVTPLLDDLTVEAIHCRRGARLELETRYFGVLDDEEICKLYAIQKHLNLRLNDILSTVLISFHQIGLLGTLAIMLFFAVKFQRFIWETGPIACVVVFASVLTPLAICYCQSNFFGDLVDMSDDFKDMALKICPRKTMFRRFAYSCQTYFVEEAYPFFHYDKNTFLEFCAAGVDYAINLMFW